MLSFFSRIFRLFWRQESGATGVSQVVAQRPDLPIMPAVLVQASAPVEPVVPSGDAREPETVTPFDDGAIRPAPTAKPALFASRLQAVEQLNPPATRSRKKAKASGPAGKPLRKADKTEPKRRPETKCGIMTARLSTAPSRQSAEIIDLGAARRARRNAASCAA